MSSRTPATWLAPYGEPPLRVLLRRGSVYGIPAMTQPWCSSGSIIDSSVDSCPPCIVEDDVNTPAGFPTSVPLAQSPPSPSIQCLSGAAMLPKRVGLPSTRPAHSCRSPASTYGAPSSGTGGAAVVVTAAT